MTAKKTVKEKDETKVENEHKENILDLRKEEKKEEKKGKKKTSPLKIIMSGAIVFIVIINLLSAYAIYVAGWSNTWTKNFVKVFPYPAAKVGWNFVSMNDFYKDLDSFVTYYKTVQKVDFSTEENKQVLEDLKKEILDRLINQKVVARQAKKMKLSVSKEEIDKEYNRLVQESGEETLKKNIKDYYNWDVATFKDEIKNSLLQQKLEEAVRKDQNVNGDQQKKAEEVLNKLRNGEDFATVAKNVSESTDSTDGGNMGWLSREILKDTYSEDVINQIFAIEKGQVSDVIHADDGFEIIKVEDKKENEILTRHILIKYVDFAKWLEDRKNEYGTQKIIDTKKVKI